LRREDEELSTSSLDEHQIEFDDLCYKLRINGDFLDLILFFLKPAGEWVNDETSKPVFPFLKKNKKGIQL
jgi:hypothetical protein